jgi:hypothetical protein
MRSIAFPRPIGDSFRNQCVDDDHLLAVRVPYLESSGTGRLSCLRPPVFRAKSRVIGEVI